MGTIAQNLEDVRNRIGEAAHRASREPSSVLLIAVSKTHPLSRIEAAYAAGQRHFGENRLEELLPKMAEAGAAGLTEIRWHLIGPIQSRKTRLAAAPLAMIHAVDRLKIAARLSQAGQEAGMVLPILLEVNISGEASKHGFAPQALLEEIGSLLALPGVKVQGLMTMAPFVQDEKVLRRVFAGLASLHDHVRKLHPTFGRHLSMGMTNDFEIAIEEGATMVRIGSAIFGERGPN